MSRHLYAAAFILVIGGFLVSCSKAPDGATPAAAQALAQAEAVLARDTATANNAERQKANAEDLFKRGLIPRDQYQTQMASADALQATLAADRAAVETAKLNLSYTRISAPISGRTGT